MDKQDRLQLFLEKLTKKTLSGKMDWKYLADSPSLASSLELTQYNIDTAEEFDPDCTYYDPDNSFYFEDFSENMTTILYTEVTSLDIEEVYLLLVPTTRRDILKIGISYRKSLVHLRNSIKKNFPNPEDYIDSFLNDFS